MLLATPSLYVKSCGSITAEGGTPPYQYSIAGCDSTVNAKTGLVQAASDTSTCQLLVVDGLKASATLKLQIIGLSVMVSPPPSPFPIMIKFFGALGKLFTGYVKSLGPLRKQSTHLLRRFLVELDRHGIAVLNPAGAERVVVAEMTADEAQRVNRSMGGIHHELTNEERNKIIENERKTAFCILKDPMAQAPSLNGLIFANLPT